MQNSLSKNTSVRHDEKNSIVKNGEKRDKIEEDFRPFYLL